MLTGLPLTMTYSIRQIASEFDISLRALRFYEVRGLVAPFRDGSGVRHYSDADRAKLRDIVMWTSLGFTLTEIKAAIPSGGISIDQLVSQLELLRQQRSEIDRAIAEIEHLVKGAEAAAE